MENILYRENEWVEMRLEEDVLYFKCKEGIVVDEKAAAGILKDKNVFTNGKPVPAFVDYRGVKYFTMQARELVCTKEYISNYKALAILLGSHPQVIMGNFFLYMYKQSIPIKMFTNETKAREWIAGFGANKLV